MTRFWRPTMPCTRAEPRPGYATDTGDYGLYITKLWGTENGGSYGYCLNNAACMSLTDPVVQGII